MRDMCLIPPVLPSPQTLFVLAPVAPAACHYSFFFVFSITYMLNLLLIPSLTSSVLNTPKHRALVKGWRRE